VNAGTNIPEPFTDVSEAHLDRLLSMTREKPEFSQWVRDRIPVGRVVQPEDVASAVVFAASAGASLITGTSLVVDGGWTAQ
jgi:NAD(P)-dependent dehydrogenase (short-subunit alcohol dehydrogenase family)